MKKLKLSTFRIILYLSGIVGNVIGFMSVYSRVDNPIIYLIALVATITTVVAIELVIYIIKKRKDPRFGW